MAIIYKLAPICVLLALASAQSRPVSPKFARVELSKEVVPPSTSSSQEEDSYFAAASEGRRDPARFLNLELELPRLEPSTFAFFEAEPSPYLRAPSETIFVPFDAAKAGQPSQELQVPSLQPWNPDNDPQLYFHPLEEKDTPTALYPKKYDKKAEKTKKAKPEPTVELNRLAKLEDLQAKLKNRKALAEEAAKQVGEQDASATGFDNHQDHQDHHHHSANGGRFDFQMHGFDGPMSYKWGFDTGKGHNSRQFHYEERDKDGQVVGHYGYYDKHGKLRMVKYKADPHEGFKAEEHTGSL